MLNNFKAKVFFADSRQLSKLLPEKSVDLILTGPPYWNEVVYSSDDAQLSRINDYPEFLSEISKCWDECSTVIKDGGIVAIWVHDLIRRVNDGYQYIPFHSDIIKTFPKELVLRNIYIWDRYLNKDRGELNSDKYGTRVQYILIFQKEGSHSNNQKIEKAIQKLYWQPIWYKKTTPKLFGSMFLFKVCSEIIKPLRIYLNDFSKNLQKLSIVQDEYSFSNYITECPKDVSDMLISLFSSPGDLVLDPFAGSGTTLKSALSLRRHGIGIEVNKESMQAIKKKLSGMVTFL